MQETQVRSLGQEDTLEEEMATHPRILAWKIPQTEEPGRLQSIGLQRIWHVWATEHSIDSLTLSIYMDDRLAWVHALYTNTGRSLPSIMKGNEKVWGGKTSHWPASAILKLNFFSKEGTRVFFKKIHWLIYFWLHWVFFVVHRLSLVVVSRAYSLTVMLGLLIAVASLVVEHRLYSMRGLVVVVHGAQRPLSMGNLPRPGEPVSPALAGRLLTTGPPGKSRTCVF